MVVVVIIAGAAVVMLYSYNKMSPAVAERVLFSIQQQAAVLTALCACVFAVVVALRQGRPPGVGVVSTVVPAAHAPSSFGRVAGSLLNGA